MVNNSGFYSQVFAVQSGTEMVTSLVETGGLFRVAVKLMMACATTHIDT